MHRFYAFSLAAKESDMKFNYPITCNIKKYNEGYEIIRRCFKRKFYSILTFDTSFRLLYAVMQSTSFALAIIDGYISYINVFCWIGFYLILGYIGDIYRVWLWSKKYLPNQELIEGKNQIETFSNEIISQVNEEKKYSFVIKIYEPYFEFYKRNKLECQKLSFNTKTWKKLGVKDDEMTKVFYFLFSFSYKLHPFFENPDQGLSTIRYVYHNLQQKYNSN
ncbi:hypothetical protein [Mycoplasmopsis verecunda]|nr:hypothetical protein [Mycoplasmopsis verecunda]WPB54252.1 hypothetical protein SAM46_02070 [Mycoplasmopsis verecunda]